MNAAGPPPTEPIDPARAAESNTTWIIAVTTSFHALAVLCVGLRVYAKVWATRAPGWDDVFMVCCAVCAIGGWSVFIIQSHYGLGKHQDTIEPADYVIFQRAAFWQSIISATGALTFLKISIATNLLRLGFKRWYRWSLWAIIVSNICFCISGVLTFMLFCRPMAAYWDKSLEPSSCAPVTVLVRGGLANTVHNILTDIALASLPIPIVLGLKMDRRSKLYVVGILSLGYVAVALGIVKSVYQLAFATAKDKTFEQSVQFWGFLQLQTGIIAACATSLKPLLRRILRLPSSYKYNYNYNNRYGSSRRKSVALVTIGGSSTMPKDALSPRQQKFPNRPPNDDADSDKSNFYLGTTSGNNNMASATFYKHDSDGSASADRILPPRAKSSKSFHIKRDSSHYTPKGIVRTTEVTVERGGE